MKGSFLNKSMVVALVISVTSFYSCKKFMNTPETDVRGASNDPSVVGELVTGAYSDLLDGDTWGYGNDVHGFSFIAATNIISDDAKKGSTSSDQLGIKEFDDLNISTSNVFVAALWKGYYYAIGDANYAISIISSSSLDTATKNEYTAEMRFLRGYYYFNLIRMFGSVPMILRKPSSQSDLNSDLFNTRVDTSKIYDSVIIPDLQYAFAHLPLKSAAVVGHATKGSAEMLLAKVFLYRKSWNNTLTLCEDIISTGQYQLLSDYSLNWKPEGNNNAESIFEIEGGNFNNTDLGIQLYSECQGPRVGGKGGWTDLGWGFDVPTQSLASAFEANDMRKNVSLIVLKKDAMAGADSGFYLWDGFRIPAYDSVQDTIYNYKSYNSEIASANPLWKGNRDYKEKNVHLMRFAEVYLLAAEAANEMGQSATAIGYLNMIRSRAGLPNTTAASQSDLRNAIWQERHVELALEHDRYWDLVRTGRAAAVMTAAGKTFVTNKDELLPIPAVQIALSNNRLKQNPGY